MPLPLYLALTAPELSAVGTPPRHLAYMACHFSACSTGLSNFPSGLPEGSMLILNDSTPAQGHDPILIGKQLAEAVEFYRCSCLLLDLQRPVNALTGQIVEAVLDNLSCPVAVSEGYAQQLECPVFVSAPPANKALASYLAAWKNRQIWLEASLDARCITVDNSGSRTQIADLCDPSLLPHRSEALHCHYKIEPTDDQIMFTLQRTAEDLSELLAEAEELGVSAAVGLYQELDTIIHCF